MCSNSVRHTRKAEEKIPSVPLKTLVNFSCIFQLVHSWLYVAWIVSLVLKLASKRFIDMLCVAKVVLVVDMFFFFLLDFKELLWDNVCRNGLLDQTVGVFFPLFIGLIENKYHWITSTNSFFFFPPSAHHSGKSYAVKHCVFLLWYAGTVPASHQVLWGYY